MDRKISQNEALMNCFPLSSLISFKAQSSLRETVTMPFYTLHTVRLRDTERMILKTASFALIL